MAKPPQQKKEKGQAERETRSSALIFTPKKTSSSFIRGTRSAKSEQYDWPEVYATENDGGRL